MNGISGFFKTSLIVILAFGLMTAFSVSSFAANATWNGSVNQDWANVSNWDGPPASAPGSGDTATFDETKGSIGNGYPITNIPESTSNPVNVTVTNTGAAATVTLPSITIGTLIVNNGGQATNTLLQFSGPVKVKTAVTIQTTAAAGGFAKVDLNGNTLSGVDSSVASLTIDVDAAGSGDAELLDTGSLIVGAINVTVDPAAGTDEAKLTSGSDITASGATVISAGVANGDATLIAGGNFSGTSVAITSNGAGVPTLNIQTFDLTLSGAFTFTEAAAGNADPVFSSSNSTLGVGSLVINATTVSLSAITTGNIDILSATLATASTLTMNGTLTATGTITIVGLSALKTLDLSDEILAGGANIDLDSTGAGGVARIIGAAAMTVGTIALDTAAGSSITPSAAITQTTAGAITASGATTVTANGTAAGTSVLTLLGASSFVGTGLTITTGGAGGGATVALAGGALDLSGNLTLVDGGTDPALTGTTGAINIGGNLSVAGALAFGATTVTFDGTAAQTVDFTAVTLAATNIRVSNVSNTVSMTIPAGGTTIGGTLVVDASGTVDAGSVANILTVTGATSLNGKLTTGTTPLVFTANVTVGGNGELEATGAAQLTFTSGVLNNGAGGVVDLAATSMVNLGAAGTFTVGNGSTKIGLFDNADNFARNFTGSGAVTLLGLYDTTNGTHTTTSTSTVTVTFSENVTTTLANVTLSGPVVFNKSGTQILTLTAAATFSASGLATVSATTLNLVGPGAAATLTLSGGLTVDAGKTFSNTANGKLRVAIGAGKTVTNNGTIALSGVVGERLLLDSTTIGSSWTLANQSTGTIDFEWVAVRDSTLTKATGSNENIVAVDSVVNATGNTGWTGLFASPTLSGGRAITTFSTTVIAGDTQNYDFHASLDGTLTDSAGVTGNDQVEFSLLAEGGAQAGNVGATWESTNDVPSLSSSPSGNYYIYLVPDAGTPDVGLYVIIGDFTLNVSNVVFLAANSDGPTSGNDTVFTSFVINWTDNADAGSTIELRYSTTGTYNTIANILNDSNTTSIASVPASLGTPSTDGSYQWDTSALATDAGQIYYIYVLSHSGSSSYDVSAAITLKGLDFTLPADSGTTADTATLSDNTNLALAWTDWDKSVGDIDIYVSTTLYTTVATVTATSAATSIPSGLNLNPALVNGVNWDLTTGFGVAGVDAAPEGSYYVYAIADDPNSSTFDELVTAPGKVTVVHNPFFTSANMTVTSTADSGATAATPGIVTIDWAGNDVDDVATVALFYALSTTNLLSAADVETNATALASGLDSSSSPVLVTSEAEDAGAGYLGWDYYSATILAAAGEYKVWAVMTDASGDKAFKGSVGTVTISHSPNIEVIVPTVGTTTTVVHKYLTVEWTDVDSDDSAKVDLFYGTTDLVGGGTGGSLLASQVIQAATFTKITSTSVDEDNENASDRYLTNLAGFNDSQTYYIFGLIDVEGDGTYEAGHQSGQLIVNQDTSLTVTSPAVSDFTTQSYTINWNEQWSDNTNVPMSIDLYFDTVNTRTLADLDDTLGTGNAPLGIIARDVAFNTDSTTGEVIGTNTTEWDDIVLTSTTAATGGTTTTLIDTSADSPLLTTLPNKYFANRRLIITGGSLENSTFTITGYNPSTQEITFTPAATAAVSATSVQSYKIVIPDGTYYVYAVMDTDVTSAVNNSYNVAIDAATAPTLTGTAEGTSTTTILEDAPLTDTADLYVGARLIMTGGTAANIGQSRTIVAYDGTSKVTVSPAFPTAILVNDTYKIDTPEIFNVSQGSITITNHTVALNSPSTFHDINDYFDIDQTLDTNGQAITSANIHINFNNTTLQLADESAPFSGLVTTGTTTTNGASPVFTTLIAVSLASVNDIYNTNQIVITSGVAKGERRTIVDYLGTSKTVIVDQPFSARIVSGVTFRIDAQLSASTTIGTWSVTVVKNSGSNSSGQADLTLVSTVPNATSFAATANFVTLTFKAIASGNIDVTYAFDETNARLTRLIDNTGAEHIPHDGSSVHIKTASTLSASISGTVLLEGRTNHQETITFELRQPGSVGHYSGYTSPEDTDSTAPGIQLQTTTAGGFTLTNVPNGKYFLTAKASHYLRGQNHHTTQIEVTPGESITGISIRGYNDANADGDFADAGEEFTTLLAGEAGTEDNQINIDDVTAFANNFGLTTTTALAAADVNGDGAVDVLDFTSIAKNFGKTAISPVGVAGVANAAPAAITVETFFELVGLPSEIELGDEVEVEIRLKSQALVDIMGYGFDIAFDSEKVAVSDSVEGDFLADSGKTFFVANQLSKKLTVGNALIHGETNDASRGTLLKFKLKPVVSGDTVLTIDNPTLIQRDGNIDFNSVSKSYSIRVIPKKIITKSALLQNYPNPFNPETWIPYALKNPAQVKIHIYNMQGQVVRTLELGFQKSAEYVTRDKAAYWDGRNNMGEHVASGIYFYRILAEDFSATRRMLVVK